MIKKKLFRYSSVFMCAALMACSLAACGTTTASNTQTAVIESQAAANDAETTISDAISSQFSSILDMSDSSDSGSDKDETVYVFTDANGNQDHVIVNEKLKNRSSSASISDFSTLSNIQNLTGDESYTSGSGQNLTWSADGNSITYQGTTEEEAPVTIEVTYYLDGKEISPDDLAGQSGKVTMHFDYTNNETTTITVNGETKTVYVPFTMITGMMLPSDKFSNIEITNGKLIDYGDGEVAMGITMPGLTDSLEMELGGEDVDLDIPESFEVTADVTDFELDMTMTVAVSDLLSDINLDDISLDDVQEQADTLQDASTQLVDGTTELSDGIATLADSVPDLTSGVATLDDAASTLVDATSQLADGSATLSSGASQLADGIYAYADGVSQVAEGASSLSSSMETYVSKFTELYNTLQSENLDENVSALASGASQISEGINGASGLLATLSNGASSYKSLYNSTYTSAYESILNAKVVSACSAYGLSASDVETALSDETSPYYATVLGVVSSVKSALAEAGIPETPDVTATNAQTNPTNQMTCMIGALCTAYVDYSTAATTYASAGDSTTAAVYSQYAQSAISGIVGITQYSAAYTSLSSIYTTVSESALPSGSAQVAAGLTELQQAVGSFSVEKEGTLCTSLYQLVAASQQLESEGVDVLSSGIATLAENNDQLTESMSTLSAGSDTLASNLATLADKSEELKDGTSQLNSASVELGDGVTTLNEGALTLKDGMITFNDTGIEKLCSLLTDDSQTALDTLKGIINAGSEYQSFAGKSDSMTGTVKFIYKTDEITK